MLLARFSSCLVRLSVAVSVFVHVWILLRVVKLGKIGRWVLKVCLCLIDIIIFRLGWVASLGRLGIKFVFICHPYSFKNVQLAIICLWRVILCLREWRLLFIDRILRHCIAIILLRRINYLAENHRRSICIH